MKKKLLFGVLILIIIIGSCTPSFPTYPASKSCNFSISDFAGSSSQCYTNQSGTGRKIKLKVNVVIKIIIGSRTEFFSDKSVSIEPVLPPSTVFPFQFPVDIPVSGPFEVEVNVLGDECSPCANGSSDPRETPYGSCPSVQLPTTPVTYRAAKPQWHGTMIVQDAGQTSSVNLGDLSSQRITNVPNSCGCSVTN